MEHRLGMRHPVSVATALYPRESAPVIGLAREVSISGMFVEAPAQGLTTSSLIEVEISLPSDGGARTFRWLAMVIRKTDAGVGLMFDRLRPPAIMRVLAAAEHLPHHRPTTPPHILSTTPGVL